MTDTARPTKRYTTDSHPAIYHQIQCGIDLVVAGVEAWLWLAYGSWPGFAFAIGWLLWFAFYDLPRYRSGAHYRDEQEAYRKTRDEQIRTMFDKNCHKD